MPFTIFSEMKDKYEERKDLGLLRFNHHQLQKRECLSDEADSRSSGESKKPKAAADEEKARARGAGVGGDGASIEVVKRPRGRPPGSKNKPKPPVVITREAEPSGAMRPHVLEIPSGHDVVDCLSRFSRRRNFGICVLAGTGAVANITLRQPPSSPAATIGFHGRLEILSISATFLPPAMAALSPATVAAGVSISLAGPQGQIVGGTVAGPLVAAGTVVVVAAAFSNPTFHRLPSEDDVAPGQGDDHDRADHSHAHHHHHHHQQQQVEQDHQKRRHHALPAMPGHVEQPDDPCAMSIYSSHLPSEVIWAPTARPPPPY
ncbi:AT-hook motif nuclear-localized protein 17 [Typha angustifolia]|uniref:AT-hook motif nuclear-localized protein 17 n=1 Tax=Typha angustifolia TaxID=59011 RepID=UPI003C2EE017